jgi:uncharacterized protein YndB with AHSA1/START domain
VNTVNAGTQHEISLTEYFEAPRLRVFANWTQSHLVRGWFAPDGFTVTECLFDARPGAQWRVTFESRAGERHTESGEFLDVRAPEKLVFTLTQQDGHGNQGPPTLVTVDFVEDGGRTRMDFRQSGYRDASMRDANQEGWGECFRKLASQLP